MKSFNCPSSGIKPILLLSTILVFNCSKEDPAPPSIVGKWLDTTITYSNCDLSSDDSAFPCTSYIGGCSTTEFKADGTFIFTNGASTPGTYTFSGSTLTYNFPGAAPVSVSFILTSTTLTISGMNQYIRSNPNEPDGKDDCLAAVLMTRQ